MARVGFTMKLKPGHEAVYRQKHDEIWPEMVDTLHRHGIRNYTIFRQGLTLFAYHESDGSRPPGQDDPVVRRWWQMMEPFMEYNADGTPMVEPLEEVFHLD